MFYGQQRANDHLSLSTGLSSSHSLSYLSASIITIDKIGFSRPKHYPTTMEQCTKAQARQKNIWTRSAAPEKRILDSLCTLCSELVNSKLIAGMESSEKNERQKPFEGLQKRKPADECTWWIFDDSVPNEQDEAEKALITQIEHLARANAGWALKISFWLMFCDKMDKQRDRNCSDVNGWSISSAIEGKVSKNGNKQRIWWWSWRQFGWLSQSQSLNYAEAMVRLTGAFSSALLNVCIMLKRMHFSFTPCVLFQIHFQFIG